MFRVFALGQSLTNPPQPSSFMQNIPLASVLSEQMLLAYYSPDTLQGFLDLSDLAAVARLVLLEGTAKHSRARYELVGQNCTFADVAREIATQSGQEVKIERVDREQLIERVTHINPQGEYQNEALDRMLYYYNKRYVLSSWIAGCLLKK